MKAGSDLTNQVRPSGLGRRHVQQLLSKARNDHSVRSRIEFFSRQFIGQPYKPDPLIGSADTPEVFTASLDGFDCVTYIETVVALALASSVDEVIDWLRRIRYQHGLIHWKRRNHYMTQWIRHNTRAGILRPLPAIEVPIVSRERVLNAVAGLPIRRTTIKCVPKPAVSRLAARLQTGDLISFVSTRTNLDVFHEGIIVRDGEGVRMRHASRSQGLVVEQELSAFLKANRMAGVIAVRVKELTADASVGD